MISEIIFFLRLKKNLFFKSTKLTLLIWISMNNNYASTSQNQNKCTDNQRDEERNDPTLEVRRFVTHAEHAQQAKEAEEKAHPEAQTAIVFSGSIARDVDNSLVLISGLLQQRMVRCDLVSRRLIHVRLLLVRRLCVIRRRTVDELGGLIGVHVCWS